MKFVVRLHAEITIKSRSVRKRYGKVLTNNLRKVLADIDSGLYVKWLWDRIEVSTAADDDQARQAIIDKLSCTPGISWFAEVIERPLDEFEALSEWVAQFWLEKIAQQTFAVRVKRKGHHDFSSQQLERYIGGYLLEHQPTARVQLKSPEHEITLQIIEQNIQLVGERRQGLGGFPIPTQETVLSLMSGGFDSSVASFEFIRRGARTHFCFFNLGGDAHEVAVKQICHYLWERFTKSHPIKFVSVDFAPIVEDILTNVDNGAMGVVLKRQMLRAATRVGYFLKAQALVTGEAIGQVSSQTLANLQVIDKATDTLVLRPLITADKQTIVDQAKRIGTEALAKTIPEYCGVISNKPTVKANEQAILAEEEKLDMNLIEHVVRNAQVLSMQDIADAAQQQVQLKQTESDKPKVIVDIRTAEEIEDDPLTTSLNVIEMPFFKVQSEFVKLDDSKHYLLYCSQGVMSKMQTLLLQEAGYDNVSVYEGQDVE
ncbi:tRNA uracil 4-sulfurtransferase ThiI [Idiomarina sp.]|uniref:tRNA uracil 4-sulfurtransferase ThiI n=1 Tax=Idiomarina sp. TaxID=1874361 RepID=UPI00351644FB